MKHLIFILFIAMSTVLSAQTVFLQESDLFAPPSFHEWSVTVITSDGVVQNLFSGMISTTELVVTDLDMTSREYIFTHYINGERIEQFVYDCYRGSIAPAQTEYTIATVMQ